MEWCRYEQSRSGMTDGYVGWREFDRTDMRV